MAMGNMFYAPHAFKTTQVFRLAQEETFWVTTPKFVLRHCHLVWTTLETYFPVFSKWQIRYRKLIDNAQYYLDIPPALIFQSLPQQI